MTAGRALTLFGLESELAVSARDRAGRRVKPSLAAAELVQLAAAQVPSLPAARGSGYFLANGARWYVDQGGHPEVSTPECTDPLELVRQVRAGEHTVAEAARELERSGRFRAVTVQRANVSYTSAATWGSHESHRCRARGAVARQLVPHLASRIVYTGAGGLDPLGGTAAFSLSPRSAFIAHETSSSSTSDRALVHTKDEPLGRGGDRLHLVCGETLCSDRALWLRIGTTALIAALADAGLGPGDGVRLRRPVEALHAFARDPTCAARVAAAKGGTLAALDVQRHYLRQVEAHLDLLPPWAEALCAEWRATLDALDRDPGALAARLDWPAKRVLLSRHAEARGVSFGELARWDPVLAAYSAELGGVAPEQVVDGGGALAAGEVLGDARGRLLALVARAGLDRTRLPLVVSLRTELQVLDVRFGALTPGGLCAALEASGALDFRLVPREEAVAAASRPPPDTRAALRGAWVQRLRGDDARCDWEGVWDVGQRRFLDLGDPFEREERWEPMPVPEVVKLFPFLPLPLELLAEAGVPSEVTSWDAAVATGDEATARRLGPAAARAHEQRGRQREARRVWRAVAALDASAGDAGQEGISVNNCAFTYLKERRYPEAARDFARAGDLQARAGSAVELANARCNYWTARLHGEGPHVLATAEDELRDHAATLRGAEDARELKPLALLGRLEAARGRVEEAIPLLEHALARSAGLDWPPRDDDAALLRRLRAQRAAAAAGP